jgi:hypothetical protein
LQAAYTCATRLPNSPGSAANMAAFASAHSWAAICAISSMGGLRGGQLGPDQVPVIWAKVFAGHLSTGGLLDCFAVMRWHRPTTGAPLVDGRRLYTQQNRQLSLRSHQVTGLGNW